MPGKRTPEGIRIRHRRQCRSHTGRSCNCRPSYEAWVYNRRAGRKIRRTFPTLAAAKGWRADAQVGLRAGRLQQPSQARLRPTAEAWLAAARAGTVLTRSGDRYRPATLAGYEAALRDRILPDLGGARLGDITRADVQEIADRMLADGLDPSTIRNALMPLRAICRRAVARGEATVNPTSGLELPAVRGRRERIASPAEAAALLAALPEADRALWATALYGGLRRGELQALRHEDVDLRAALIRVERAWDEKNRVLGPPKSAAGRRSVPVAGGLRGLLAEHQVRSGRRSGLLFGSAEEQPFTASAVWRRARRAWAKSQLAPIGLHEARHTFASLMIAAGVNARALSAYMGHSSVSITYDRYGHLMPGNEREAIALLDAYLTQAVKEVR